MASLKKRYFAPEEFEGGGGGITAMELLGEFNNQKIEVLRNYTTSLTPGPMGANIFTDLIESSQTKEKTEKSILTEYKRICYCK
jgi:hypothetical protein